MLKKRLAGVITVKDGWALQSFGYARHLPLGRPEVLAENLDRWGVDEIIVQCIDRTRRELEPDFKLLRQIALKGLSTPLTFGGGVSSVEHARTAVQLGADRICLDSLLWDDPEAVEKIASLVGAQAVIGVLPLGFNDGEIQWRNYRTGACRSLANADLSLLTQRLISEVMIVDWKHEGTPHGFQPQLAEQFPIPEVRLIAFGGLSSPEQLSHLLATPQVDAVAIGNFLTYREHAVQHYKLVLANQALRPARFERAS